MRTRRRSPLSKDGQTLGACVSYSYYCVFVPQLYEHWPVLCVFEARAGRRRVDEPAGGTR